MSRYIPLILIGALSLANTALAQDDTAAPVDEPGSDPVEQAAEEPSISEIMKLIRQQQEELASQRKIIDKQNKLLEQQQQSLDALRREIDSKGESAEELLAGKESGEPEAIETVKKQEEPVLRSDTVTDALETQAQIAQALEEGNATAEATEEEIAKAKEFADASDRFRDAQRDDPTESVMTEFPGSIRIPGTNALVRIGGYVKTTLVNSIEPLAVKDRFIVGAIPVSPEASQGVEAEANISVSQSRLNFELREPTDLGVMRAFVEGDFAEDNDTFRLRHAFGHWDSILAGKTWSVFMDTEASPEEIDFEGLNGRVNVRQGQVRFSPSIGQDYKFQVSLEDPKPSVEGGEGVTEVPDIVASVRVDWFNTHFKVATLLRQVRAQLEDEDSGTEAEYGYGISISGSKERPMWDARNKMLFQLTAGRGIGRYINDLSTVGDYDGVFSPEGNLDLVDVVSGYISGQHWWGETLRSNVTFGYVEVDNPGYVPDDAYKRTFRSSFNLIWSPMPRILLGGEYLWGFRENEGGDDGDASQIQFSAKYHF